MYQAPYGIDLAGNVFGRQGYPFPLFRSAAALGADTGADACWSRRRSTTFRYDNVWDTDLRVARTFKLPRGRTAADRRRVQRVQRQHRAGAEQQRHVDVVQRHRAEHQPAILRLGLVVGF